MLPYFIAVRNTDTGEWLDFETMSRSSEVAQIKANGIDQSLPGWARANPVVRVARVQLTELAA